MGGDFGYGYSLLADLVLLLHVCFVGFVVFSLLLILVGRFLHWSWVRDPWFRSAHLIAIGIVVAQAWAGVVCPLTILEIALRERAGESAYAGSFIAHWLSSLLFYAAPAWMFTLVYTTFAALVLWTWCAVRPRSFRGVAPSK